MITKNHLKILAVGVLIGLCGVAFSVFREVKRYAKPAQGELRKGRNDVASYTIYIPSPVERAALNRINALWPETFSAQHPLIASKLPQFYRALFETKDRETLQLGAAQMAVVRSWSMDANTASLESLKSSLLIPLDQIFGDPAERQSQLTESDPKSLAEILKRSSTADESECSLFQQERLFRIAQAWPQFQKDASSRYRTCVGPEDLISVWFDLNELLFSGKGSDSNPELNDSVGQRLAAIQQKGSPFDAFMADRLSQAAFLKATHGESKD